MEQITVRAYAKINLFLEVLNLRSDGYHNIKTLFQTVDLADEVSIEKAATDITLLCDNLLIPLNKNNLAFKAAELMLQEAKIKMGVKIKIVKNIPVTAGLAGGSSDAAAVLNGCNVLLKCNFTYKKLAEIALQLGSDVPFLLKGGMQLGEGRGELLTELELLSQLWLVLVIEGEKKSTGSVFKTFKKTSTKPPIFDKTIKYCLAKNTFNKVELVQILHNDLEVPAGKLFPEILKVKEELRKAGARGVLMSGSGPAVFGLAYTKSEAEKIAAKLKIKYEKVLITKTIKPQRLGE